MSQPFGKDGGPVNKVGRNTWDLSYQTNGTYNFGGIYPVYVQEVIPGDHFKIDTTFGLRFMPTAFPLQTRMRADIHYFYVRNRALYDDWMDHYGMKSYGTNSKQTVPPFISPKNARNKDMFATGSLGDYLGIPTTIVGEYGYENLTASFYKGGIISRPIGGAASSPVLFSFPQGVGSLSEDQGSPTDGLNLVSAYNKVLQSAGSSDYRLVGNFYTFDGRNYTEIVFSLKHSLPPGSANYPVIGWFDGRSSGGPYLSYAVAMLANGEHFEVEGWEQSYSFRGYCSDYESSSDVVISVENFDSIDIFSQHCYMFVGYAVKANSIDHVFSLDSSNYSVSIDPINTDPSVRDVIDIPDAKIPWEIKPLKAYVFRAYEMIYNSFYRDDRNNPYVLNGEIEYNKYLPTTAGGEDTNIYKLHYRNWEQDFLTTAVPTPQMGPAPLVGISSLGEMSIQDPDTGQVYKVMAKTAEDADTIVGMDVTESLPNTVMRSLVNYASSGISINDFRNVNAFQRWLETNIRKGFKYKDQIKAHYDVDIRFDELLMPEFIGGASIDILPATVTQTSQDSETNPLGSYAGQLYGSGSSKHPVSQYCDEHGFIIGLLSVVPVPNYSQLMPKHFWKTDSLDYFSPEFGHIGLQPIPSREVCPIQMVQDSYADLEKDVFGYQRGWYDYLQRTDEVHGQFRTSLRNFVMNRVFDSKPELGPSFTVIDPAHLNDVFTVQRVIDPITGDEVLVDKIIGQIYFNVSSKRPIPKFGIPRLE